MEATSSPLRERGPIVEWEWTRYSEGQIVVRLFGWRVRLYLGHSYFDRPRIHTWAGRGSRGIVLRLHRGVARQRVAGAQWRRLSA